LLESVCPQYAWHHACWQALRALAARRAGIAGGLDLALSVMAIVDIKY
jgi:hypothetical protein